MDPDETLKQLREFAKLRIDSDRYTTEEYYAAERIIALDEWLSNGGFLPKAWDTRCFCQEREQ